MKSILCIGDSCVDFYHYGVINRMSPEAPVPIVDVNRIEKKPGMASNVLANLSAFGHNVIFITQNEIIEKRRFIDERTHQHILRVDKEVPIKPLEKRDIRHLLFDAIVISDYDKGYISQDVLQYIIGESTCPVFIDTKKTNLLNFEREECFIKVNEMEYSRLFHQEVRNLIVTLGDQGCKTDGVMVPVEPIDVFDATGAGDVFIAAFAHAYLKYGQLFPSLKYANKAARLSVQHSGVYTLTEDDIKCLS